MIARHQRIVFWCMVCCIVAMAGWLAYERHQGRQRIAQLADATPIDAPTATTESVTLLLANDANGSLTATDRQIALPAELTARARALLDHLVAEYALPGSPHPLTPGAAVNEVFLVPLPSGAQLAVIDLRGTFVNQHPSGVEVETLTLASIVGTLHANLPQIGQVRFLVDGQQRETLAGHADLLRTYPSHDTTTRPASAQ